MHLPADFRSLPRLSSPSGAQASTVRPFLLSTPVPPQKGAPACKLESAQRAGKAHAHEFSSLLLFVLFHDVNDRAGA